MSESNDGGLRRKLRGVLGKKDSRVNLFDWGKLSSDERSRQEKLYLDEQKRSFLSNHRSVGINEKDYDFKIFYDEKEYPRLRITRKGFDSISVLNKLDSPIIEVGGPTLSGFRLVDVSRLNRKVLVSDLADEPGIDFQADTKNLPFADNSLSGVFASALSSEAARNWVVKEGQRVLKEGGLLVLQGFNTYPVKDGVREGGVRVVQVQKDTADDFYYVILQKNVTSENS